MGENKKIDQKLCTKLNKKLDKASKRIKKLEKKRTALANKIVKLIISKNKLQKELNAARGFKPEYDARAKKDISEEAKKWYEDKLKNGDGIWSDEMPPIDYDWR